MNLKIFIKQNDYLITVLGVFSGLSAFFTKFNNPVLSFASLMIVVLLSWELWVEFPESDSASTSLKLFEMFYIMIFFGLVFHILSVYKNVFINFSFLGFMVIYIYIFIKIFEKFKLFKFIRKFAPEGKSYSPAIRGTVAIIFLALILLVALFSGNILKRQIEQFHQPVKSQVTQ